MSGNLTCKHLVALIAEYFDGVLTPHERTRFDAHIAGCRNCAAYLAQLETTRRLVGKLGVDDIEPRVRDALLAAFRDWTPGPAATS